MCARTKSFGNVSAYWHDITALEKVQAEMEVCKETRKK
jgi:hypothetical protein